MEGKDERKVVLRPPRVCQGTHVPAPNTCAIIMMMIVKLFNVEYIVGGWGDGVNMAGG